MTAYEVISTIDSNTLDKLFACGFLRANVKRNKAIYEYYLDQIKSNGIMQSYQNTADKFCLDVEQIRKIIAKFK